VFMRKSESLRRLQLNFCIEVEGLLKVAGCHVL